jgi:cytosine/adenosine deaminase-related metal-dependent hydrolase
LSITSLKARVVAPIDRPPIAGGIVTFSRGRIVDVAASAPAGAAPLDLGDVALLPGLVNAHTHLEFSDLEAPLGKPSMRLVDWIRLVIARRSELKGECRRVVADGLRESLHHGVTTVCDITTADVSVYADAPCGPDVVALLEVIGFSRARAASALAATEERLLCKPAAPRRDSTSRPDAPRRDSEDATYRRQLLRRGASELRIGLSPHAPYTVSPLLLEGLVRVAKRDRLLVAMHLAESPDELELLDGGSGPFRDLLQERGMWDAEAIGRRAHPVEYLKLLAVAPRALVIHGTYLDGQELQWLADHRDRVALVYCPRTHSYFNQENYPLAAALKAGTRVALGTDSRASTPDLSLLSEARHAARRHTDIDPDQLLRMATLDAAEALGIADDAGSITPGKLANLTAVPIDSREDAIAAEAILASDAPPVMTWYRGAQVARNDEARMTNQ